MQPTVHMTAKALAEFMHASEVTRWRILEKMKFPSEDSEYRVQYWATAEARIRKTHREHRGLDWLEAEAAKVVAKAAEQGSDTARDRLLNNAEAMLAYAEFMHDQKHELVSGTPLELVDGQVKLSTRPQLQGMLRGRHRVVRLDLVKHLPRQDVLETLDRLYAWAMIDANPKRKFRQAVSIQVHRARMSYAKDPGSRFKDQVRYAWRSIEAMWPEVGRPGKAAG